MFDFHFVLSRHHFWEGAHNFYDLCFGKNRFVFGVFGTRGEALFLFFSTAVALASPNITTLMPRRGNARVEDVRTSPKAESRKKNGTTIPYKSIQTLWRGTFKDPCGARKESLHRFTRRGQPPHLTDVMNMKTKKRAERKEAPGPPSLSLRSLSRPHRAVRSSPTSDTSAAGRHTPPSSITRLRHAPASRASVTRRRRPRPPRRRDPRPRPSRP